MELILIRTYHASGTNGMLLNQGKTVCYTIELPWLQNKVRLSCIPEARYHIKMRFSKKFGTHMLLEKVNGRTLILIHPANDAKKELKGCIAPVTILTGEGKGILSRNAHNKLKSIVLAAIEESPVFITIKSNKDDNKTKSTGTYTSLLQKTT